MMICRYRWRIVTQKDIESINGHQLKCRLPKFILYLNTETTVYKFLELSRRCAGHTLAFVAAQQQCLCTKQGSTMNVSNYTKLLVRVTTLHRTNH